MAAHQAPPSLEFSRQEHWSGLSFPSPMHESEKWKWSLSVMSDSVTFILWAIDTSTPKSCLLTWASAASNKWQHSSLPLCYSCPGTSLSHVYSCKEPFTYTFHIHEPPLISLREHSRNNYPKMQNASSRVALKPLYLLDLLTNARPRTKFTYSY